MGERPDYRKTLQHMSNIDPLLVRYFEHWLDHRGPVGVAGDDRCPPPRKPIPRVTSRTVTRVPCNYCVSTRRTNCTIRWPTVCAGPSSTKKTFFDKISVAVQPLLEKLLAGRVGELVNPDYADVDDPRPILDWPSIVRQRAVVYCGFDALTDSEVAAAVAQGMLADWVGYAGELYKHGLSEQQAVPEAVPETCLHLDEFAELARGPEIIQALNKGRGAGLRFSLYTQTLADIAAGLGNRDRAGQVIGNVSNTLVMLRVADLDTADLLVKRLGKVEVDMLMQVSGATDSSDPDSPVHFTSNTQDRVSTQTVPLLDGGHLMQLPRGQAFVLMSGGQLYKVQFPGGARSARSPAQPSGTHRPRHGPPVPAGHRDGVAIPGFDPLHRAGVHASPGTRTGRSRAETRADARRIERIETRVGPSRPADGATALGRRGGSVVRPDAGPGGSHRNG